MGKGKVIAGFVMGIVGIVMGCMGTLFSILGLPVAVIGLVLSVNGGKQQRAAGIKSGLATAGLVLGIIAVVFTGITFFTCGICTLCIIGSAASASAMGWEEIMEELMESMFF
ncbi:MAG: hypothetical protein J6C89_00610 [Clostridia bacterium]|nr:hypothetical protein [Clostridia bacterium]